MIYYIPNPRLKHIIIQFGLGIGWMFFELLNYGGERMKERCSFFNLILVDSAPVLREGSQFAIVALSVQTEHTQSPSLYRLSLQFHLKTQPLLT